MKRLFNPTLKRLALASCFATTSFLACMDLEHIPLVDSSTISGALVPSPMFNSHQPRTQGISYEALDSSSRTIDIRTSQSSNTYASNLYEYPTISSWLIFRSEFERAYSNIVRIFSETSPVLIVSHREEILSQLNTLHDAVDTLVWPQLSEDEQVDAWRKLTNSFAEFVKNIKIITARTHPGSDQRLVDAAILTKIVRMNFAFQGMAKLIYQHSLDKQRQAEAFYDALRAKILSN